MKLYYIPEKELTRIRNSEKSLCNPHAFARIVSDIASINAVSVIAKEGKSTDVWSPSYADVSAWMWTQLIQHPSHDFPGMEDMAVTSSCHEIFLRSLLRVLGIDSKSAPVCFLDSISSAIHCVFEEAFVRRCGEKNGRVYVLSRVLDFTMLLYVLEKMKSIQERKLHNVVAVVFGLPAEVAQIFSGVAVEKGWNSVEYGSDNMSLLDESFINFISAVPSAPSVLVAYGKRQAWLKKSVIEQQYERISGVLMERLQRCVHTMGLGTIKIEEQF